MAHDYKRHGTTTLSAALDAKAGTVIGRCMRRHRAAMFICFAKLFERKTPITAADLLNDRVLPSYEEHGIRPLWLLTGRGTEVCGNPERHECGLYLTVRAYRPCQDQGEEPRTNGICERFHKILPDAFHRAAFRKKVDRPIDQRQADLDAWLIDYNHRCPRQGRWCFGTTPIQTFLDALPPPRRNSWRHERHNQPNGPHHQHHPSDQVVATTLPPPAPRASETKTAAAKGHAWLALGPAKPP